jgi:hypothetical protein
MAWFRVFASKKVAYKELSSDDFIRYRDETMVMYEVNADSLIHAASSLDAKELEGCDVLRIAEIKQGVT